MTRSTQLKPLSADRARQLLEMTQHLRGDTFIALALDDRGEVLGLVGDDDAPAQHLLADRDTHS